MKKYKTNFLGILLMLLIVGCTNKSKQKKSNITLKDSVVELIKLSDNSKDMVKRDYTYRAFKLAKKSKNDSLILLAQEQLCIIDYQNHNLDSFKIKVIQSLNESKRLDYPIHIAKADYNLGSFYFDTSKYDSAFYYYNKSKELYKKMKDSTQMVSNMVNMSIIQTGVGDYNSSEQTSIEALKYLSNKKSSMALSLYNNLGIICNQTQQYNESIYWYNVCLKNATSDIEKGVLHNNIGIVKRNIKNFVSSDESFQKAINYINPLEYPTYYAMVLDNIGFNAFLQNKPDSAKKMNQALNIRSKNEDISGLIISYYHLAEYFFKNNQKDKTLSYCKTALKLSNKIKDYKNRLKLFSFLSTSFSDKKYFNEYFKLNDSILNVERNFKNQFAKIKYQTHEKETENLKLKNSNYSQRLLIEKQRFSNLILIVISLVVIFFMIIVLLFYFQQKKLHLEKVKYEKIKAQQNEKQKLSLLLHDEIASDLLLGLQKTDHLQKHLKSEVLESAMNNFEIAYQKMRKISQQNSFTDFNKITFEKKIQSLFYEYNQINSIDFNHDGLDDINWNSMMNETKVELISILQESFTNSIKHSKASKVNVEFKKNKKSIQMMVKDNGIGKTKQPNQNTGNGLDNIKKRVEDLNGKVHISNNQPNGLIIDICIPYET